MTKKEIIGKFEELVRHEPISEVMEEIEALEDTFLHTAEIEEHTELEERTGAKGKPETEPKGGGKGETTTDQTPMPGEGPGSEVPAPGPTPQKKPAKKTRKGPSPEDLRFKELVNIYKDKKDKYQQGQREQEQKNLHDKRDIIAQLRNLPEEGDSIGTSFQKFNSLKEKWRNTGHVPKREYKDLQSEYSYETERFYYKIDIHKGLKELDLKKNLVLKRELLEQMQELRKETHIRKAEDQVRALQDEFEDIGPVPQQEWEPLRDAFREATGEVYKNIRDHYDNLKKKQQENKEEKLKLIDKAEYLTSLDLKNHKKWKDRTEEILNLQKKWKQLGRAPKGKNEELWKQFRAACDRFFDNKHVFYESLNEERKANKARKEQLLSQAQELKGSTEWKETAENLKALQRDWTATGATFRKDEQRLWKSFRAACDHFFNARKTFFDTLDERQEENLKHKEALLSEIKNYMPGKEKPEIIAQLKEFTNRWNEIDHVPKKELNRINNEFRKAMDALYNNVGLEPQEKTKLKFKGKVEKMAQANNAGKLLGKERRNINDEINTLESTIKQYEHNLNFFANSKNASPLIEEVKNKIERSKNKVKELEIKLKILNQAE